MKKSFFTILIFTLFFYPKVIFAKVLDFNWSNDIGVTNGSLYTDGILKISDGYISCSSNDSGMGIARKISLDGENIIWEYTVDFYGIFTSEIEYNGYVYLSALKFDFDNYRFINTILKFDDYGNVVDSIDLYDGNTNSYYSTLYLYNNVIYLIDYDDISDVTNKRTDTDYGIRLMYTLIDNGRLSLENIESYWDVEQQEVIDITYFNNTHYSNIWESLEPQLGGELLVSNQTSIGDFTYAVGDIYFGEDIYGIIFKIESDSGNLIWSHVVDQNLHYFDITDINDNLVIVGYYDTVEIGDTHNADTVTSNLFVYNLDGDLVEVHDLAEEAGVDRVDISLVVSNGDEIVGHAYLYSDDDPRLIFYNYSAVNQQNIITSNPSTGNFGIMLLVMVILMVVFVKLILVNKFKTKY